ncbi:MAG: xanthine dehydrogenase accessory protein XdhC [Burkholderiaceae bacterium]
MIRDPHVRFRPVDPPDALAALARCWLGAAQPCAIVHVTAAAGSTPRGTGTRMLVRADRIAGTIGGGHLEFRAIALARQALSDAHAGTFAPRHHRFALGPSLGQCCGGRIEIAIEPLSAAALAAWPARPPRFHLMLYGAGHVGQALVRALAPVACTIDWIDSRDAIVPADAGLAAADRGEGSGADHGVIADADFAADFGTDLAARADTGSGADHAPPRRWTISDAPESDARLAPADAYHLVMTHDHDLDLRICEQVLDRDRFGFLGLIGSRTKRARFESRLLARGIPAARIARLQCPIGMPGIIGKEPEVIALSVAAQLLALSSA